LLHFAAPAPAQVSFGFGFQTDNISISLSTYPNLVRVPGYPVYYASGLNSNYFFYDGLYWVSRQIAGIPAPGTTAPG
jgi:hypothetical protein